MIEDMEPTESSARDVDVIVVGAGPAGISAAITLRRSGVDVARR